MELTLSDDGLELSALIAPVPIPAVEPPKPEPPQQQQPQQQEQQAAKNEFTTRQAVIERVDESHLIPDNISTTPNKQKERPKDGVYKIDNGPEKDGGGIGPRGNNNGGGGVVGPLTPGTIAGNTGNDGDDQPPVMPKKEPAGPKKPVSGGVLNGQARSLPKPPYPMTAKALNVRDSVSVQVVVDEKGNVISAKAVSGHFTLRQVAEQAARQAKFDPTYLTGQPVKVTGVIIYKFTNG